MSDANADYEEGVLSPSRLLALYQITSEDQARIRQLAEHATDRMDQIFVDFYDWLAGETWFEEFFTDEKVLEHVKVAQHEYWIDFLTAEVDEGYLHRRQIVG